MRQPALPSNTAVTRESETACRSRSRKQGVCLYLGGISGSVALRNSYHSISPKQRRGFLPQESTSCRASVAQTNSYCYTRGSPSAIPFPSAGSQAGRWGAVDTGTMESTGPRDSVHCTHVLMLTGSMTTAPQYELRAHLSPHPVELHSPRSRPPGCQAAETLRQQGLLPLAVRECRSNDHQRHSSPCW